MSTVIETRITAGADDGYVTEGTSGYNNNGANVSMGYLNGVGGNTNRNAWLRFETYIPQGATIEAATLTFLPDTTAASAAELRIYGDDADDPAAPTDFADYGSKTETSAYVDWEPGTWTDGEAEQSPDISAVIQELVDRGGFSGNIQILIENTGSGGILLRSFTSYDDTPASAALLHVEISPPAYSINAGNQIHGVRANWQRVVKRVATDGTITYQPYALHTWEIAQLDMDLFLELAAQQGQVLSSLEANDIDHRNVPRTYTAAEIVSAVNARQIGRRATGVRVEFRVGVS